jgi:predicted alpha/beta-hydrolase family hydrolase
VALPEFLDDGPDGAALAFAFAHGAGGPMRSPFMSEVARGIAGAGIRVVRFEFPYMAARRRRPDPQNVLLDTWRDVVGALGPPSRLVLGGKSMGGRMASMIADETGVAGLLCFGYPFHPPGRPDRLRTEHLKTLATPAMIVQGTRDPFGGREEVESYGLSRSIRVVWIEGGDHSFKPPARSGRTARENLAEAIAAGVSFLTRFLASGR